MKIKKLSIMTLAALACAMILALGTFCTTFANDGKKVTTMAATADLNLREGPGLNYNSMAVMPAGTSVEVFGMTADGWYSVKYNGQEGYAYYVYLNFEGTDAGTVNDGKETDMYTTAPLNVRAEPSTNAAILGSFGANAKVPVVSKHDGWFKVKYQGTEGYCYGEYLDFGKDDETNVANSTMNDLVTTAPLNVRTEPSMNGKIIGSFKQGETIKVIGQEGDWLKVEYKGVTGYSHSDYIR